MTMGRHEDTSDAYCATNVPRAKFKVRRKRAEAPEAGRRFRDESQAEPSLPLAPLITAVKIAWNRRENAVYCCSIRFGARPCRWAGRPWTPIANRSTRDQKVDRCKLIAEAESQYNSMSDQRLKIAVFIDFDNVEIGVKTTLGLQFDIGAVLEAIKERGEVITKIAYGDWKRAGEYGRMMSQHAVRLVQRVMTPGGDKNGADINLALDALEMAFTHSHINAFVIVGGDSDFITLVEKLKQYDRKVFVVGGRAFTSQVMQKNCTEFIAYENVVSDPSAGSGSSRAQARDGRGGRQQKQEKDKPKTSGGQPIEQAVPLVKRALKVLVDREVTPQLGLLKSTLLQLDSSFSERDYGVGSFREFADKLARHGLVSLKHQGRSTLVELPESNGAAKP